MRTRIATLILGGVLTAGLVAGSGSAAKDRPSRADRKAAAKAALVPAGEPVDCVQLQQIRSTEVLDDSTIDFKMAGGKTYRNTLPNACPRLGFEERFSYRTSLNRLCSLDTITVLQTPGNTQGPTCGLGKFQPMAKASGAR